MEKDMYLPKWLMIFGIVLEVVGVVGLIAIGNTVGRIVCFLIFAGLGTAAFLCWRNQWVKIENEEEFVCSTMFGKKTTYRFEDITGLKLNNDSMTLLLKNGKVHIESAAIISERFQSKVSDALEQTEE